MLSVSLGMFSLKMVSVLNSLIPWRNIIRMLLGGVFIMDGLFRGCERKLHLFPSNFTLFNGYYCG